MKHVKINNNQTMGMLRTCQDDKICTIHRIVSFDKVPVKGEGDKIVEKQVGKDLCYIPIRNEKTGKIKVNTLLKRENIFLSYIRLDHSKILLNTRNQNSKMHLLTNKSKLI